MSTPPRARSAKPRPIRDELIYDTIVALALAQPDKAARPEDVAMQLRRDDWQSLLHRVRLFAVKLAQEGYVEILRKGEPVDPTAFKGVYRIRATAQAVAYLPRAPQDN